MSRCHTHTSGVSSAWNASTWQSWEGTAAPGPKVWLISAALSALAAIALGILADRFAGTRAFFVEDGPVEMVQAGLLLVIAIVFVTAFVRSAGARALFCLLAAYGCVFALTREIPRCGSAFAGGDLCLPAFQKHGIVLAASVLALIGLLLRPIDWRRSLSPSNLRWTWPCLVVLGFLVTAEGLEKLIYYSEIEEFLELVAYFHLGVLSVTVLAGTARR